MPILVYCVAEISSNAHPPGIGVGDKAVDWLDSSGLRCFVSHNNQAGPISARNAALTFHRVLENIFQQTAIIPFRFPTIFLGEAEVVAHLREESSQYLATLARLRGLVQMELRIRFKDSAGFKNNGLSVAGEMPAKLSGTEYLRERRSRNATLEVLAHELRRVGSPWIRAWRERPSAEGLRCFALIESASVTNFQRKLEKFHLQQEITAILSGPWPATEFLTEGKEE